VRSACKQGLRFLEKEGDSLFLKSSREYSGDTRTPPITAYPAGSNPQLHDDVPWSKPQAACDDVEDDSDKLPWEE
jgi:hypothetical protein